MKAICHLNEDGILRQSATNDRNFQCMLKFKFIAKTHLDQSETQISNKTDIIELLHLHQMYLEDVISCQ